MMNYPLLTNFDPRRRMGDPDLPPEVQQPLLNLPGSAQEPAPLPSSPLITGAGVGSPWTQPEPLIQTDRPDPALLAPLPSRDLSPPIQAPIQTAQPQNEPLLNLSKEQMGENAGPVQSQPIINTQPTANATAPALQLTPSAASPYDEFAQKGPEQRKLEELQSKGAQKHTGGFFSRLKDVGMTALESGFNPAAMLMVAANPQIRHDRNFRVQEGEAERGAEVEGQARAHRAAELKSAGEETGVVPGTQEPTEPARHRMAVEAETASRNENARESRDLNRQDREQAAVEKRADAEFKRSQMTQQPVDAKAVKGSSLEGWAGKVVPWSEKPMTAHEQATLKVSQAAHDLEERKFKYKQEHGEDMTPGQQAADERAYRREQAASSKEDERAKDRAEGARAKAQAKVDAYWRVVGNRKARPADVSNEMVISAREAALAAVDEASSDHPDLLESGEGDDRSSPYIKWKGGKRPPPARVAPPARSTSAPTAKAQTISRGEYNQQVIKHGQQKVDDWLKQKGISVQ